MKSEPTEKTKGKKMAVSETADRKNGRSPGAGHDEWWERLMMEPGPGESAGTDASVTESMIPSGARCGGGVRGGGKKGHPAGTGRPREKKNERQAAQGLAGGVPGNVPHRPEDQEPQDGVRQ